MKGRRQSLPNAAVIESYRRYEQACCKADVLVQDIASYSAALADACKILAKKPVKHAVYCRLGEITIRIWKEDQENVSVSFISHV